MEMWKSVRWTIGERGGGKERSGGFRETGPLQSCPLFQGQCAERILPKGEQKKIRAQKGLKLSFYSPCDYPRCDYKFLRGSTNVKKEGLKAKGGKGGRFIMSFEFSKKALPKKRRNSGERSEFEKDRQGT